jgi:hypothetical protein
MELQEKKEHQELVVRLVLQELVDLLDHQDHLVVQVLVVFHIQV